MQKRLWGLESLEPRLMMSGNVTVRVSGQEPLYNLKIDGDGQSNQITVSFDEVQQGLPVRQ